MGAIVTTVVYLILAIAIAAIVGLALSRSGAAHDRLAYLHHRRGVLGRRGYSRVVPLKTSLDGTDTVQYL